MNEPAAPVLQLPQLSKLYRWPVLPFVAFRPGALQRLGNRCLTKAEPT